MITLLCHLQLLRWVLPSVFMLGSSPAYFVLWGGWRTVTALLPYRLYRAGDEMWYSMYQRMVLFFYENYTGLEIVMYGDKDAFFAKKENVILICNHQSTVDWIIANMLAVRQGTLGKIRYILKDGLRYFPLYGFYFRQHSCIYVKRSGKFNQDQAAGQLQDYIKKNIPFWMVIFPEGTRHNERTLERSKKFAAENGLAELEYVLVPRHKAVQLSLEELRDVTDAVYDVTVAYSETQDAKTGTRVDAPGLTEFLQTSGKQLHLHLSRVPIADIPEGDDNIRNWLYDRFQQKDKMLKRFYAGDEKQRGTLGDDGRADKLPLSVTLPSTLAFAAINAAIFATRDGRSYYWKAAVAGTLFGWAFMAVRK